jgi:hypothetical protein
LTPYLLIVLFCCSAGLLGPRSVRGPERAALQAIASPIGVIRGIVVDTKEGTGIRSVSVRLQSTGRTAVTGGIPFDDICGD